MRRSERNDDEKMPMKRTTAAFAAMLLALSLSGAGHAALPAPSWMPGSPIFAGAQIILLWVPVPGAVKYNIFLNDAKVADTQANQFILQAPEKSGEYKVTIASVDASGVEGARSFPGVFRIQAISPPKDIMTRVAEGKVLLRWDKVSGAVIYNVYRSTQKDGEYALLGSVQSESFTDSEAQKGKEYFYAVAGKDLAGKESPRSAPVPVSLVERTVGARKITMKVVPSKEVRRLSFIGSDRPQSYSGFLVDPAGFGYIVDPGKVRVLKVDLNSGDLLQQFGTKGIGQGLMSIPVGIDLASNGDLYVADLQGKILVYGPDGSFKSEIPMPVPDPERDKAIQNNAVPIHRGKQIQPKGVLVDEEGGRIYVSTQSHNTVLVFSRDGKFLEFLGNGARDATPRILVPTEMMFSKDRKKLIVAQPVEHVANVVDLERKTTADLIGKRSAGFIGGFIGITGMAHTPRGEIILADSAVHSIQVFDGNTHDYLFHVGGPEPKADPAMPDRALFDFPFPAGIGFDKKGLLYVFHGIERFISVREVYWDKVVEVQ